MFVYCSLVLAFSVSHRFSGAVLYKVLCYGISLFTYDMVLVSRLYVYLGWESYFLFVKSIWTVLD